MGFEALKEELNLHKISMTVYELENSDYLFDSTEMTIDPERALEICQNFISATTDEPREQSDPASIREDLLKAFARVTLVEVFASSHSSNEWLSRCAYLLNEAEALFSSKGCSLGSARVKLLRLRLGLESAIFAPAWTSIQHEFEKMGFLPGLLQIEELNAAKEIGLDDLRVISTSPRVCEKLLPLLRRSGNELDLRLKHLHSMRSWLEGPSFILACERTFYSQGGFQSDKLALVSSRFLCMLYTMNNNFNEAYAHAVLHLRYARSCDDANSGQAATKLFLQAVANVTAVMSDPARIEELTNLAGIWDKWMYLKIKIALTELQKPGTKLRWLDLPVEPLLWLARSVSCNIEENSIQPQTEQLILTLASSLDLASNLILLAPQPLQELHVPGVLRALGTAAEHTGNPLLALQLYDEARIQCHNFEDPSDACALALQIGRRLDSLLWTTRPLFVDFLPLCQTSLKSAEEFFWSETTRQTSYRDALGASTMNARSYLRCLHYEIDEIDWGEDEDDETLRLEQKTNKDRLVAYCSEARDSIRKGLDGM
jgi:hypothetical protein